MSNFIKNVQVRWSDLDPNFHLRHSVYYDWGAMCRIEYFNEHGLSPSIMQQLQFGPIIFREECVFRKEIRLGQEVTIDLQVLKAKRDFSRWSVRHTIKRNDELSAILTLDGAWLNTAERKLAVPPVNAQEVFATMPRGAGFEWVE
jgi:acyl-CoA thioester hydrolase